ncbi:hypothetical protein K2X30_12150 [bacterium]|nr:hypothetical protein [bacterium]
MNTQKVFELFVNHIWPIVRIFFKKNQRCQHCIASEKYAQIVDGVCSDCRSYQATTEISPEASREMKTSFESQLTSYTREGNYSAVLLLSGGKDSAYILERLRSERPDLRLLCITVDNGFMSPTAIKNAEYLCERLNVDLLIHTASIPTFAKEFRKAFQELNGRPTYGVVDHKDGTLIFRAGKRIATELQIPLLIGGLTWVQIQKILGQDGFELDEPDGPHMIFPLAVWRPSQEEIYEAVRSKNLMLPGSDSPVVSNSLLISVMSVIDVLNLGYSSFEPEFAQMIREKKADRKTWLHIFELLEVSTRKGWLKKDTEQGLAKLGLTLKDVIKER